VSNATKGWTHGAGGGIRTHEGLRHRVLSPRQAASSLLPIRPGSGTPAQQKATATVQDRGRIKTTRQPIALSLPKTPTIRATPLVDSEGTRAESPRISLDQQSGRLFHTAPSSRLHVPVNHHLENRRLACSTRQTENLPQKRFIQQMTPPRNLEKKKSFPRHKRVFETPNVRRVVLSSPRDIRSSSSQT